MRFVCYLLWVQHKNCDKMVDICAVGLEGPYFVS